MGSFNYTVASRKRHNETGVFLPPGFEDLNGLQMEMEILWNSMSAKPEVVTKKEKSPTKFAPLPNDGRIVNPYKQARR